MATCTCGHDQRLHLPNRECSLADCGCNQETIVCQGCSREVEQTWWNLLGTENEVGRDFEDRVRTSGLTGQKYIELCKECGDQLLRLKQQLHERCLTGQLGPTAYLRSDEHKRPPMAMTMNEDGDLVSMRGWAAISLNSLTQVGEHEGRPLYDFASSFFM